ncbi:MAG: glycosyl transferase, partial [Gordonia sp. (in: high G+C Gram-positive bacteria)]
IWGFTLLHRTPDFVPWLRWVVLIVGLAGGAALIVARRGIVAAVAAGAAIVAAVAGPVAYTVDTLATATEGSIVSAGPRTQGGFGPGGFGNGGPGGGGFGNGTPGGQGGQGRHGGMGRGDHGGSGMPGGGMNPGGMNPGGMNPGGMNPGGMNPGGMNPGGMNPGSMNPGGMNPGGNEGGPGGLLQGSKPGAEVIAKLKDDADRYTWVAAAIGSNEASGYQLESGYSVMPIGGFNGSDPSPTLAQFQQYVKAGKIHYFIAGGMGGRGGEGGMGGMGGGRDGTSSSISEWVEANFTSTTVDGVTLYDLTAPKK